MNHHTSSASNGVLTTVRGVYAGAQAAGFKKTGALDLAYLYIPNATASVGVFTKNAFAAPCVHYTRRCLQETTLKAIVVNSGNANAATGEEGARNCQRTAELAATRLGLEPHQIGIASTGIIGKQLPMDTMGSGLEALLSNPKQLDGTRFAEAIMTTDLQRKEAVEDFSVGETTARVAGVAKGSGMIAPNMATMLAFVVCDADVPQETLEGIFRRTMDRSFNSISVDTDTSTNDMVLCVCNPDSGVRLETQAQFDDFEATLTAVCVDLAKQIARDGEGASKLLEVNVLGARTETDARALAKSVINSPLVKTAVHGADPNWGRVAMALGKTEGVEINPQLVTIAFQSMPVFKNGQPCEFDRISLREALTRSEVRITVELGLGSANASAWGCDLTKGYIDINVEYN